MAPRLPIPARPALGAGALLGREAARGLARRLGGLGARLLFGRHMLDEGADGPGQRLLVAVDGIVVGGMLPVPFALGQVIALAVHAVDELTQYAGVDPALAVRLGPDNLLAVPPRRRYTAWF